MTKQNFILFLLLWCLATGCIPQKKIVYFQKKENEQKDIPYANEDYEFIIAPFDVLSLQIQGLTDEQGKNIAETFNTPMPSMGAGGTSLTSGPYTYGLLVDKNGDIELLYARKIHLAGISLSQAADTIRHALSRYIVNTANNLTITVKILSYTVTVLGEVRTQGMIRAENEYMTLTEALSKAGGLTEYANLQNVRIVRTDRLNKTTQTYRINLTETGAISPILTRLHPNDVVVIDPLRRKQFSTASQTIGLISTVISIPLLIISSINLINR